MSIQIKFDSNQDYQLEAIDSVVSLFHGWNSAAPAQNQKTLDNDSDLLFTETLFGNTMGLTAEEVVRNARKVQARRRLNEFGEQVDVVPEKFRLSSGFEGELTDFTIEMETGTGKTYVYLRTAIELYLKYGLSKFVIVVPSVAIREGVEAALRMLKQHFRTVYAGLQYDSYLYDSKILARLRQFATSKHLQILVMNIQAFSREKNIIVRENSDTFNGIRPIDLITSVNPVVIMDEPQKLDGALQREAISGLNPLFKLRYSATHKDAHCMLYRLGPVDAYDRKLVKRIEVLSMTAEDDLNIAYVELRKINVSAGAPTATVIVNGHGGRVQKTVRQNGNLYDLTAMKIYESWSVEQISAQSEGAPGFIQFSNGRILQVTQNTDVDRDWWQRAQIQAAIQKHFETELRLLFASQNGEISAIKPLTLFFIDRVANYDPEDGKFKLWFDQLYLEVLSANSKFKVLNLPKSGAEVRTGYFAGTKGKAKDTNGDSADDAVAYDLIMKNKEQLLSPDEPIRFIFSHTALSEGWDNPNVFTICNLQEVHSEVKRRQQIGRGLRLPVMADGERNRNHQYNVLTVIASETFEQYASALQNEIQVDTGDSFGGRIKSERARRVLALKPGYRDIPGFKDLWEKIAPKTRYQLEFSSDDLISEAILRLQKLGTEEPIRVPKIVIKRTNLDMAPGKDITAGRSSAEKYVEYTRQQKMPDILAELQHIVPISRSSTAKIVEQSGRLEEARINPAQFVQQVRRSIQHALAHTLVDHRGIRYQRIDGSDSAYSAELFDLKPIEGYEDNILEVKKSIYDAVICDSNVEREFAADLDKRPDVELFIKLPDWFKIDTPIGGYNPDWALVRKLDSGEKRIYLVRETKGTTDVEALRFEGERWKIEFGRKHFIAIEVDYKIASKANQLDVDIPFKFEDDE